MKKEDAAYVCSMGYPALNVLAEQLFLLADGGSTELFGIAYMLEMLAGKMKAALEVTAEVSA